MDDSTKVAVSITKGRVGRGSKIHYLYNGKWAICGAGRCYTGTRHNSGVQSTNSNQVTCALCEQQVSRYRRGSSIFEYTIEGETK